MESINQKDAASIIERGRRAIQVADAYLVRRFLGPRMGIALASLVNDGYGSPGPYQRLVDKRLVAILEATPSCISILAQSDGVERMAGLLCEVTDQYIVSRFSEDDLAQLWATLETMMAKLRDELQTLEGDGKPPLGDELEADLVTVGREPWRLRAGIPAASLGLGQRELRDLEEALGVRLSDRGGDGAPDAYCQTLLPTFLQVVARPEEARFGGLPKSSRIWRWAGVEKPRPDQAGTMEDAVNAIANLFRYMATLEGRREIVGNLLGRQLRQEYGLGTGRGHEAETDRGRAVPRAWKGPEPGAEQIAGA